MKEKFTNLDYRSAKIIHLVNKEEERFIYQNKDISKEEAIEIVLQFYKRKKEKKSRVTESEDYYEKNI